MPQSWPRSARGARPWSIGPRPCLSPRLVSLKYPRGCHPIRPRLCRFVCQMYRPYTIRAERCKDAAGRALTNQADLGDRLTRVKREGLVNPVLACHALKFDPFDPGHGSSRSRLRHDCVRSAVRVEQSACPKWAMCTDGHASCRSSATTRRSCGVAAAPVGTGAALLAFLGTGGGPKHSKRTDAGRYERS